MSANAGGANMLKKPATDATACCAQMSQIKVAKEAYELQQIKVPMHNILVACYSLGIQG